ncbi:MAG: dienelactone hydrolase family protein [Sphingomonadaceae bacterium]|nr:dienelactone hydrolase family protein [Sphingomonadaceae bacterium]
MTLTEEVVDLETSTGPMRTYVYRPTAPGKYPGLLLFSEIFQQTGPVKRMAQTMAGNGFIVAVPEIFHELNPIGTILGYDTAGADKGNKDKVAKTIASYDDDARAVIRFLQKYAHCTGKIGSMGICIGGHLSFRAAMNPEILACSCFYATDIHKRSLGAGMNDNSLDRMKDIKCETMMLWGRQDPHIPVEGRQLIYQAMTDAGVNFTWHEFNAAHAFMRDEGPRYDPQLALTCYGLAIGLYKRKLGDGDVRA